MNQKTQDLTIHACNQIAAITKRTLVLCDTDEERINLITGIACNVIAIAAGGIMSVEGHDGPPTCTNIADFSQEVTNTLRRIAVQQDGSKQP